MIEEASRLAANLKKSLATKLIRSTVGAYREECDYCDLDRGPFLEHVSLQSLFALADDGDLRGRRLPTVQLPGPFGGCDRSILWQSRLDSHSVDDHADLRVPLLIRSAWD